ncbi:ATP-binding cassette domain-containing protein [Nonomuraea deserti]|nr:ATP-binding cassette domain-containing protein [Nonomuraea deserti]
MIEARLSQEGCASGVRPRPAATGPAGAQSRASSHDALHIVGLLDVADRQVQRFSKGMRQRLHTAIGMIADPRVIVLDEPTIGLDPIEAQRLRESVAAMRQRGVTVLLTSHHLLDVEQLADRVVVLDSGRLIHDLPLDAFVRRAGFVATVVMSGSGAPRFMEESGPQDGIELVAVEEVPGGWRARYRVRSWTAEGLMRLGKRLELCGAADLRIEQVRLEDAFATAVGQARPPRRRPPGGPTGA